MHDAPIAPRPTDGFRDVVARPDYDDLNDALNRLRLALDGRRLWHVNSTARGGGVAELLAANLRYVADAGVDVGWLVLDGTPPFFDVTKRIHNYLHDAPGDGGGLGAEAREIYATTMSTEFETLARMVRSGDVVVLHDPQTAGLVPALRELGVHTAWRCHVGVDDPGERATRAWDFLRNDVEKADVLLFSREAYVWDGLSSDRVAILPPCIDVLTPKNLPLSDAQCAAILREGGLVDGSDAAESVRVAGPDGESYAVCRRADMTETAPAPLDAPLVTQVSRWDRLKDPAGLVRSFADAVCAREADAHLVVAGPRVDGVDDDPEGSDTFAEVARAWSALPPEARTRVHLACLPTDDADENALLVNALQQHSAVIAQKSLAEGFGLTVTEAMWKKRPVVAGRVGGIQDQIVDGESGVLVDDPGDDATFGEAITGLVEDTGRAAALGAAAHQRVCEHYLPLHHFANEAAIFERLA